MVQAFAWNEIVATLRDLKAGRPALIPQYDFVTSARHPESVPVQSADVVLFDGILAFYSAGVPCNPKHPPDNWIFYINAEQAMEHVLCDCEVLMMQS